MMKEKYYEAGEILTGLIHPKGKVTNDKLTGAEAYVPKGIG